jgi:hypothetical protein
VGWGGGVGWGAGPVGPAGFPSAWLEGSARPLPPHLNSTLHKALYPRAARGTHAKGFCCLVFLYPCGSKSPHKRALLTSGGPACRADCTVWVLVLPPTTALH